jgi:hypothetical protein
MTAQPTEIRQIVPITSLTAAESPLQRQILLWQQELLRRPPLRGGSVAGGRCDGSAAMPSLTSAIFVTPY